MERIRQAVEQAQQQRQEKKPNRSTSIEQSAASEEQSAASESSNAATPTPAASSLPSSRLVPTSEVEYKQTPTIEVDMATRERNRLIAAIPGHPQQDIYRMLRTQVLQVMDANNWKSIAVTSPTPNSGKTLTAINLAISIAMESSHAALLVDADLRYPTIHKYFGYSPKSTLGHYLFDEEPVAPMLFRPDMNRLTVLPGRLPIHDSAEALGSPKWVSLLNEASSRYPDRIVVIDIAPVLNVDDALTIAPHIDCVLMVAENGRTKRDELQRALELLDGYPLIGTVLNKSGAKVAGRY
jgi:capsular exopolysaccharide synthesis family protein